MSLAISLAERGLVPDPLIRQGIRRLLRERLAEQGRKPADAMLAWTAEMARSPIALVPAAANAQHYEVPPAFYEAVLGPQLKYSSALWEPGTSDLAAAERAMLAATVATAQLADGQRVLELGCGWGSLSLHMARTLPGARITAVSNSAPQRAFILERAAREGLTNLSVLTADMNTFQPPGRYDRVVSVEMFEHMRNWEALLGRLAGWLEDDGAVFLHVFAHRIYSYPYEDAGEGDWMARNFFTGGLMPSHDLISRLNIPFDEVERTWWSGPHYARTCEAWLERLDAAREPVVALFAKDLGVREARRAFHRWRIFFLACAELFAFDGGAQWGVSHHLLRPRQGRPSVPSVATLTPV